MAILEKEVWVKCGLPTDKYYKEKGYKIPCYINEKGKLKADKSKRILVKIEDIPDGSSSIKVTKICDICGHHSKNIAYSMVLRGRCNTDGKDRCFKCGVHYRAFIKKEYVKYDKSLEFYSIKNNIEYLLDEFSTKNKKHPKEIAYSTKDEYLWVCPSCNSEYPMPIDRRTIGGSNCPFCVGARVNHTNCLWTTHPEVAKLLKNQNRGYEITHGIGTKEIFVCQQCEYEKISVPNNIIKQGFSCPRCSDGLSYPEKIMFNALEQTEIPFKFQESFKWSKRKRYDFYIPSLNCIIETHGEQHVKETGFTKMGGRTLYEEQENDKLKEKLALENGIKHYIVIDCQISDLYFIKENIMNSELSELINLKSIDWEKCQKFTLSTMIKDACNLWNEGIENTKVIGDNLNLSSKTIRIYLKKGAEIGWCDYNAKKALINSAKQNGELSRKRTIQLSMNGDFIREWDSATEAAEQIGVALHSVSRVCRKGLKYSVGGYKWLYEEDYNKLKENIKNSDLPNARCRRIVQLKLDNCFYKEWNSIKEASNKLSIVASSIFRSCNTNYTAGGFKWMYKEDYEKYISKAN
ncbi:zinc-ribbon domain-containing protein [Heyndrickxia camelliae]|uniref:Treble clef zinc finger domain-containing protein n=1 Tax=Heyndrickxia camelliae TaxID=1707093 RepID=A0A2N3LGB7_9BACI|nr:zinc-ribbon domain-containing protein [Heyndrickxia camelliae]PKR83563.1 hypothetical protein CWO92_18535 [Heyndrickxia camelliae]